MQVRNAGAGDMRAVAELSRALAAHVRDPDPGTDVAQLLRSGFAPDRWFECLVAVIRARVVGFATYGRIFEAHTRARRLWLGDLYVDPGARRQGVGRALVAALRVRATELGCTGINLELVHGNTAGRSFYRKLGARPYKDVDTLRLSTARQRRGTRARAGRATESRPGRR
jgi:GNAT superfamily N-acetyltransferase